MRHDTATYLTDILEAGKLIQQFTSGKTRVDYEQDVMLRAAIERQFTIIGEALSQAVKRDSQLASHISGTRLIIDFRNRLIHGYTVIDHDVVWGVIVDDLPRLITEVRALLTPSS